LRWWQFVRRTHIGQYLIEILVGLRRRRSDIIGLDLLSVLWHPALANGVKRYSGGQFDGTIK
jgi:hypothetical protein